MFILQILLSLKGLIYESVPPSPAPSDAGKQAPITSEDKDEDEFGSWSEKNNVSEDGFIPKC